MATERSLQAQSSDGVIDPSTIEMMASAEGFDWLEASLCRHMELDDFFVRPGALLAPEVMLMCEICPVRVPCVKHSYALSVTAGYFGALSPGFRARHTVEEALEEARETTAARLAHPEYPKVMEILALGPSETPVTLTKSQRSALRAAARKT